MRRERAQRRPKLVSEALASEPSVLPDQHEATFINEVVLGLPRNLRDVYCLSRFAGLTYAEIAVHQGISVKAVEKRLTKAFKLCAARFGV